MSTPPVVPVAANPAPAVEPKKSAIQIIEQEIIGFIQSREKAIANVHAIDGAIQAGQQLLAKLKAEEAKAVGVVKKVETAIEEEASKVVEFVKEKI